MESEYIGKLNLQKYPKIELEDSFVSRIDPEYLEDFYRNANSRIKSRYTKYIIHMLITIAFGAAIFYLGFYFYQTIFPLSVIFSVLFVAIFIYSSKSIEIKAYYFKFFRPFFLKAFIPYCPLSHSFTFIPKKKKTLIYLSKSL